MIHFINKKMNRIASGRNAVILLLLTFSLMFIVNTVNMPYTVPWIQAHSNHTGILDTKLTYGVAEVYQVLDAQQAAGRETYLRFLTTFDLIFPLSYSISLTVVLIVFCRYWLECSIYWKIAH